MLVVDMYANTYSVDVSTDTCTKLEPAVFQNCTSCQKKITYYYRSLTHAACQSAFVECEDCGYRVVIVHADAVVGNLSMQFESITTDDSSWEQVYNRRAWTDDGRLVYCEKDTGKLVEYKWSDIIAGTFDKPTYINHGMQSTAKPVDIVLEGDLTTVLLRDGSISTACRSNTIQTTLQTSNPDVSHWTAICKVGPDRYLVSGCLATNQNSKLLLIDSKAKEIGKPTLISHPFAGSQYAVDRLVLMGSNTVLLLHVLLRTTVVTLASDRAAVLTHADCGSSICNEADQYSTEVRMHEDTAVVGYWKQYITVKMVR